MTSFSAKTASAKNDITSHHVCQKLSAYSLVDGYVFYVSVLKKSISTVLLASSLLTVVGCSSPTDVDASQTSFADNTTQVDDKPVSSSPVAVAEAPNNQATATNKTKAATKADQTDATPPSTDNFNDSATADQSKQAALSQAEQTMLSANSSANNTDTLQENKLDLKQGITEDGNSVVAQPDSMIELDGITEKTPALTTSFMDDTTQQTVANAPRKAQIEQPKKNQQEANKVSETKANTTAYRSPKPEDKASLLTNEVVAGSPEATVQNALDTLYYGDAKAAVQFYQVEGMPDFDVQLQNTQNAFKQTVEKVTIHKTHYNLDKTEATLDGEIKIKGMERSTPMVYKLKKIDGQWKILG